MRFQKGKTYVSLCKGLIHVSFAVKGSEWKNTEGLIIRYVFSDSTFF